jgi:hypothetical protein
VGVVTSLYSSNQQKKAARGQANAIKDAQEADARTAAEAETNALVAANAQRADASRRRRSSSLLGGGDIADTALGGGAPLAAGGPAPAARAAAYGASAASGTALGAGAPSSVSAGRVGRVTTPRTPSRSAAV